MASPGITEKAPTNDSANSSDIILKVTGLSKKFGNFTAVDHISFEIHKGEVFGLLGHNGRNLSTPG